LSRKREQLYKNFGLRSISPTWSQDEYGHVGFQRWFLHSEAVPRCTTTWSLLEGATATGVIALSNNNSLRIASIGGGPGFELIACQLFFRRCWPNSNLSLTCLDLCKSWGRYVTALGYRFEQWDLKSGKLLELLELERGQLDYVILSSVTACLSVMQIVGLLVDLLTDEGVRAVLVSSRVIAKGICEAARKRGIFAIWLNDQAQNSNDRQLAFMICSPTVPSSRARECIFPDTFVKGRK